MFIHIATVFTCQQLKKIIATWHNEVILVGNKAGLLNYSFDKLNDTN